MKIELDVSGRLRHALDRLGHLARIERIFLQRQYAAAAARDFLLERGFHHRAIGVVRHQRGKRSFSTRNGEVDDAPHVALRQEAQEVDAARRHAGVGGKRDHRNAARAGDLADGAHGLREQRADDDLGALVERLLRAGLRGLRHAGVVFDQQLDVRILEFVERHFRRVLHRLRGDAGVARRRQRQDQADLDLPRPDHGGRRRFGARRRRDQARLVEIASGAGAEHGGRGGDAQCGAQAAPARPYPSILPRHPGHGRSPTLRQRYTPPVVTLIRHFVPEKLRQ